MKTPRPDAVQLVGDAGGAQALLHPTRQRLLEALTEPDSAAGIARRLGLPRQLVNYHLKELHAQNLVVLVETRQRGNATERLFRRSAAGYTIAPQALGRLAAEAEGERPGERYSSAHQVALANRVLRELTELRAGAEAAGQSLPTFALEVDVRFASAAARSAFAQELSDAVAELVRRHHDASAPRGRTFRCYLGAYPKPKSAE